MSSYLCTLLPHEHHGDSNLLRMRVSAENRHLLCLLYAWQWLCNQRNSKRSSRYLTSNHKLPICLLKKLLSWIFSFPDCLSSVSPAFWSCQRMQINSLISFNTDILTENRRLLAGLIIWKAGEQMRCLERWPETLTGGANAVLAKLLNSLISLHWISLRVSLGENLLHNLLAQKCSHAETAWPRLPSGPVIQNPLLLATEWSS